MAAGHAGLQRKVINVRGKKGTVHRTGAFGGALSPTTNGSRNRRRK